MRFGSKYYLYYMGDTAERPLGDSPSVAELRGERRWEQRNNQRVGVAVADNPDGPWQRMDQPLVAPTPGFFDALCCTDPTVTARPGGGYVMVYKGVGDKGALPFGGPVVLLAATSDSPTGPVFTGCKPIKPVFITAGRRRLCRGRSIYLERWPAVLGDHQGPGWLLHRPGREREIARALRIAGWVGLEARASDPFHHHAGNYVGPAA